MTKTAPLMSMTSILLSCSLLACSYGNIDNHGDSANLASDHLNQYYPNEFRLHTTYMGELFDKDSVFVHHKDPNFVVIFKQNTVEQCVKTPNECQEIVRALYEQGKHIADVISGVNVALSTCQIPVLGVADPQRPTLLVETPISNKALTRLHECLMGVYPLVQNTYYKNIHLELIAPSATPSPVQTVTIFDDPKAPRQQGAIYNAYFSQTTSPTLTAITLAPYAPFTDRTKKAMIDEARRYLGKTKQGYMTDKDKFDPFTSELVFNPDNIDEYHLYIEACSQPYKPRNADEAPCQDSVVSLKYHAKTGKFYDHKWISTPNQDINMQFDLPKPF